MSKADVHVYPENDLRPHELEGFACPCEPSVELIGAAFLIIHNAYDHREIIEQAVDIMNEESQNDDPGPIGNEP